MRSLGVLGVALALGGCVTYAPVGTVQMAPAVIAAADGKGPGQACAVTAASGSQTISCVYPVFDFSAAGDGARDAYLTNVVAAYTIDDGDGQAEVTISGEGLGVSYALASVSFDVTMYDAGGGRRQILHLTPQPGIAVTCDAKTNRPKPFVAKGWASAQLVTGMKPLPLTISSIMLRCPGG